MAARGVEDLGGIGVRVIADASQIRKGFDQELKGLTQNPTKIPVTIDDKGQIAELKRRLRDLSVPIKVTASRESVRDLKRNLQQRVEGEGGVIVPVKIKSFSAAEATTARNDIIAAITGGRGAIEIPVVPVFRGQPIVFAGGAPGGTGARGPGAEAFAGPGMAHGAGVAAGAAAGTAGTAQAEQQANQRAERDAARAAQQAAAAAETARRRTPRTPKALQQQPGETEAAHRQRLLEKRLEYEARLEERGTETRTGRTAYNRLIDIRRLLGEEKQGPTAKLPPPRKEGPYPERFDTAGRVVRGGADIGPLVGEAASRVSRPFAEAEIPGLRRTATGRYQHASGPRRGKFASAAEVERLRSMPREGPASFDARQAQGAFGVSFDPESGEPISYDPMLLNAVHQARVAAGESTDMTRDLRLTDIARFAHSREAAEVRRGMGFKGQRATRAAFGTGQSDLTVKELERALYELESKGAESGPEDILHQVLRTRASKEEAYRESQRHRLEREQTPSDPLFADLQRRIGGRDKSGRMRIGGKFASEEQQQAALAEYLGPTVMGAMGLLDTAGGTAPVSGARKGPKRDPGRDLAKQKAELEAKIARVRAVSPEQILEGGMPDLGLPQEANLNQAFLMAASRKTELLAGAFDKKGGIPGVGPATAKRFLAGERGDFGPNTTEAQQAWIDEMTNLTAILGEIRRRRAEMAEVDKRKGAAETAAATRRGETTGRRPMSTATGTGSHIAFGVREGTTVEEGQLTRRGEGPFREGMTLVGGGTFEQRMGPDELRRRGLASGGAREHEDPLVERIEQLQTALKSAQYPEVRARVPSRAEAKEIRGQLGEVESQISALEQTRATQLAAREGTTLAERGAAAMVSPRTQGRREKREDKEFEGAMSPLVRQRTDMQGVLSRRGREARLKKELEAARAELEQRRAAQPDFDEGPTVSEAAEGVPPPVSPGVVGAGEPTPLFSDGGGGFFGFGGFGGGGGGPIDVKVVNFPEWMSSQQSQAASPIGPAITGTPGSVAQMERELAEHEATVGPIVPPKGTATKAQATQDPGLTPISRPSAVAAQLVRAGDISREEAEGVLRPLGVRPPSDLEVARREIQEILAQSRQGLPIRGAPVSIAQLVAGPSRGKTTARFSEAERILGQAAEVERGSDTIRKNLELQAMGYDNINKKKIEGGKLTKEEIARQKTYVDEIQEGAVALEEREKVQQGLVSQAAGLAKLKTGEKVSNLIKSFGGSLAGLTVFSAALGATTAAIGIAGVAIGDYLERASGYTLATQQISNALSDQTKASGGAVKQVVAQTAAQANLTDKQYEGIKANLEQRASIEAGNKAYDEQLKLTAASRNFGRDQRGGFDQGLFQTTGGILGTPLLGTPSTGELVSREIESMASDLRGSRGAQLNASGRGAITFPGARDPEQMDEAFGRYTDKLDDLNDRFEGTGLKFVAASEKNTIATEEAAKAFDEAGFGDVGTRIRAGDVAVPTGTNLNPDQLATAFSIAADRNARPDPKVLLSALEERVLPAMQFQIRQNLKDTLETFIPAQRGLQFLAQPQAPFERGLLPGGTAPSPGLNIPGQAPGQFGGVPESAKSSFREYQQEASAAIDAINAKAAEGERVLADKLGVPESSLAELKGLGQRIGEINQQQADIRLDLQFTQFNRQLFIARRTLGDLAGMTDRAGATVIGQLQRQDQLLGRRSQALSLQSQQLGLQTQQLQMQSSEIGQQQNMMQLARAQRQVNFQRAAAGFTAPGTTPEERAARIEEAKVEADYAQKEIDFQRQQLGIQQKTLAINREQFQIQQASVGLAQEQFQTQIALQEALNERAYQDQAAAIAEMQKAFDASMQLQALENLKGVLTKQAELLQQEIEAQAAAEEDFIKAQAQFATDIMSQTGEFVTTTVAKVRTVFDQAARAFESSGLGRFLGFDGGGGGGGGGTSAPTSRPSDRFSESSSGGGRAAGYHGVASSPTQITVGEAGTEEIAILRNPRRVFAGGMGGGGGGSGSPIIINVMGNNINADDPNSLAEMADKIARLVEERLGRRMVQLGLRTSR